MISNFVFEIKNKIEETEKLILELLSQHTAPVIAICNAYDKGEPEEYRLIKYNEKIAAFHRCYRRSIFYFDLQKYTSIIIKLKKPPKTKSLLQKWEIDRKFWLKNCHHNLWQYVIDSYNNQNILKTIRGLPKNASQQDIHKCLDKFDTKISKFINSRKLTTSSIKIPSEIKVDLHNAIKNKAEYTAEWTSGFINQIKVFKFDQYLKAVLYQRFKNSKEYHMYAILSAEKMIYWDTFKGQ